MTQNSIPDSIFYIHESVFELAGMELTSNPKVRPAYKFLSQCVLINVRFRKIINGHISYSTEQIIDLVKSEDYASNFKGFTTIGANMVYPITKFFDRNKTVNLVKAANSKNVDVVPEVKIVANGYEDFKRIEKLLKEHDYPLEIVSVEEALEEITKIHELLKNPKPAKAPETPRVKT